MSPSPSEEDKVADDDVFAITAEGEKQLKESETALSQLELRLLVLVNGISSASQICARTVGTPAVVSIAALRALLAKKMICAAGAPTPTAELGDISVGDFLKTTAFYVTSASPTRENEVEANEGISYLQKQGYYVCIARRAPVERKPAAGARLNVVIIEDERPLAKLMSTFLSIEGFEVRTASNRDEIVETLRKPPVPDLVLLDVMLPDANGFEILGKLRHHPAFKSSAIVMLTGEATREAVLKGLAGGADGYITKPFEIEVLMKTLRAVLGVPQG